MEEGWKNAIRPTLLDYKGKALIVSTPKGKDYFYSGMFLKGLDDSQKDWKSFHYSTYDNPFIDIEEIDEYRFEYPEAVFNQEILAVAGENAAAVVSQKYIEANTIKELSTKPTVVYGIDISVGGNGNGKGDYSVITGLDEDGAMSFFDRWRSPDFDILYNKVNALPATTLKYIDQTGLGRPALFELQKKVNNIQGYTISSTSKPELIKTMILSIEQGRLKFNEHTANELSIFEYTMTSTGYIKYGNKSGGYDDAVISLALANKHLPNVTRTKDFLNTFYFG